MIHFTKMAVAAAALLTLTACATMPARTGLRSI